MAGWVLFGFLAPLVNVFGLVADLFLTVHQALFSLVNLGFGIAAGDPHRMRREINQK